MATSYALSVNPAANYPSDPHTMHGTPLSISLSYMRACTNTKKEKVIRWQCSISTECRKDMIALKSDLSPCLQNNSVLCLGIFKGDHNHWINSLSRNLPVVEHSPPRRTQITHTSLQETIQVSFVDDWYSLTEGAGTESHLEFQITFPAISMEFCANCTCPWVFTGARVSRLWKVKRGGLHLHRCGDSTVHGG